jgi:hypothetical protein
MQFHNEQVSRSWPLAKYERGPGKKDDVIGHVESTAKKVSSKKFKKLCRQGTTWMKQAYGTE